MIDPEIMKMRQTIHQWCAEDNPINRADVPYRRERIIKRIMNEFGVSREEAEHNFKHNNDLSD